MKILESKNPEEESNFEGLCQLILESVLEYSMKLLEAPATHSIEVLPVN